MRTRAKDRTRGLVAVVGLIGAISAIPWALIALGQRPPSSVVSVREIRAWLAHPITDSTVVRAAGLLCWAIWALFVLAVAIEVIDRGGERRGRRATLAVRDRRWLR